MALGGQRKEMLVSETLLPGPIPLTFHATQEPSGEITIRRVNPPEGITDTFTFEDEVEMRSALSESHSREDLYLLFHELAKSGSAIFHARWIKGKPKK